MYKTSFRLQISIFFYTESFDSRNRIKRLTREVVRLNEDKFKDKSYVFVAKSVLKEKLKEIKYKNFEYDILKVLKR